MASAREFFEKRYQIVCERIEQPNIYNVDSQGNFLLAYQPDQSIDYALVIECWLIKKLLNDVEEGQEQQAIVSWHKYLSERWDEHCQYYFDMRMAHIDWVKLPWSERQYTPEPPTPPELELKDVKGRIWVVDQRTLDVLLDIQARLAKWLGPETEQVLYS